MAFVLGLIGCIAIAYAGFYGWRIVGALRARRWPKHSATIRSAELMTALGEFWSNYILSVEFEYRVSGARIDRCTLPSRWGTSRAGYVRRLRSYFHQGATVPVHVHPSDPTRTCLLPGAQLRDYAVIGYFSLIGFLAFAAALSL